MNIGDWIPALSTTSLLAIILWLFRSLISTRLTASVQHEFDGKIETLKTEYRKREESFKADLRSKETQIEALRSGALSGLVSRQSALYARRIQAVDQIWAAVHAVGPAKLVSATIAALKYKEAVKASAEDPKAGKMFSMVSDRVNLQNFGTGEASKARSYVSEMSWAVFSAYLSVLTVAMLKMEVLRGGVDVSGIVKEEHVQQLLISVLPHQAEFVRGRDSGAYHYLLDELENCLMQELRKDLHGAESDKETVRRAGEILRESENVIALVAKAEVAELTKGNQETTP